MSGPRKFRGRGKRKLCERGDDCPFKHEHQHLGEYYHPGDAEKGGDGGGGKGGGSSRPVASAAPQTVKPFKGKGHSLGGPVAANRDGASSRRGAGASGNVVGGFVPPHAKHATIRKRRKAEDSSLRSAGVSGTAAAAGSARVEAAIASSSNNDGGAVIDIASDEDEGTNGAPGVSIGVRHAHGSGRDAGGDGGGGSDGDDAEARAAIAAVAAAEGDEASWAERAGGRVYWGLRHRSCESRVDAFQF